MTESVSDTAPRPQRSTGGPTSLVRGSQSDSQCWVVSRVDGLRIRERASTDSPSDGYLDTGQSVPASCEARLGGRYTSCGGSQWWIPVPYQGRTEYVAWACVDWYTSAPQPRPTYIVQRGDTLSGIAERFGVSLSDLLEENPQITNPDRIFPGQVINIP